MKWDKKGTINLFKERMKERFEDMGEDQERKEVYEREENMKKIEKREIENTE